MRLHLNSLLPLPGLPLLCHPLLSAAWLGLPDTVHRPLQGRELWQDTAASLDLCVPWAPNELLMSRSSGFRGHEWQGKNTVPAPSAFCFRKPQSGFLTH